MNKFEYWDKFVEDCGEEEPDIERSYFKGWNNCKNKILEILKTDLQNLDLSTDSCDRRYIEKIEKL